MDMSNYVSDVQTSNDPDWYWYDPDHDLWNEEYEFEIGIRCQACYGSGMDRHEDADCLNCYGEGVVYGDV